jgi:predicted PurR-regulated permease PerM
VVKRAVESGKPVVMKTAAQWGRGLLEGLVALFVVVVVGIYLAAQPRFYLDGLLMLFPHAKRPRLREVAARVGFTLRWWMIGQLVPMLAIGAITAIGLKLIGVELWLILGLLTGLFNFIPNFGPLIAGVPAVLLALASPEQGPQKALWVVALFVASQNLEGYVLTPLVQRRAVQLPPALTILTQVLLGMLLGAIGVVLAAPLTAAAVVMVKMLYVEDVMGDDAKVDGAAKPA